MSKTVTAIYNNRSSAEVAVERLLRKGHHRDEISVMLSGETQGREFGVETNSKAPEGAATGGAVGGTLGAIAAGLAAVSNVAVPGVGLVAAGPILAALAGAGAGAATGGIIGGLVGLGIPEHEAKTYAKSLENGNILIGVEAPDEKTDVAEDVFQNTGGKEVTKH